MRNNNEKQNKNDFECNDFNYETLLKSEGKKINEAKYSFQEPSLSFQKELKMKILEERSRKFNSMKKISIKRIFEILTIPLQPKYAVSVISIAIFLFVGLNFALLSEQDGDFSRNLVFMFTREIPQKITEKIGEITKPKEKIDDWQYAMQTEDSLMKNISFHLGVTKQYSVSVPESSSNIGFSTGGAKDVNNFRENIESDYLPLSTDITYEGLFYDYYFDTGQKEECNELFCPSYSYAVSKDPFSNNPEYYLSVGLNSGIKESDFERKKLNLVVVLDISGSMSSPFNRYYYDQFGIRIEIEDNNIEKSKIEIAKESVIALLGHLNDEDRFGMVLFNNGAYLAKPLNLVGETDMEKIKDHIAEIQASGGTNMSAGMKMGAGLFDYLLEVDYSEYENRIIFLTDAMPNLGVVDEESLLGMAKSNSENNLYSTLIGVGVDFNTELTEVITKIKGANYYSVHSSEEFKKRMDDEFEYMVTPLVFNLELILEAQGYSIEKVYGSPEADEATGEIMKVNTLFPSSTEDNETRGGLVLLKLKKISSDGNLNLKVSYEDRTGNASDQEAIIEIKENADYFENNGIRKGVLLTRYANIIKNWINDERKNYSGPEVFIPSINQEIGLIDPDAIQLGEWERQSISLRVSKEYKNLFKEFKNYFEREMSFIDDDELSQEIEIMDKLINY